MTGKEKYLPEGVRIHTKQDLSPAGLEQAKDEGRILEACAFVCDAGHNLLVELGHHADGTPYTGIIPREECAVGLDTGKTREIAILSRVGKPVCFKVLKTGNQPVLSRKAAQQEALSFLMEQICPGDILKTKVTHLEPFGAFVDVGCGIISLIGIENISVSRIFHPSERFFEGQSIYAAVLGVDKEKQRISLTHRELLGTWQQNAEQFHAGETVRGIVRSVEPYGIFIELAPNLSGLAEKKENVKEGQHISVYIKSILPERMKIKLSIIESLPDESRGPMPLRYFFPEDSETHMCRWIYTPDCCQNKHIETIF